MAAVAVPRTPRYGWPNCRCGHRAEGHTAVGVCMSHYIGVCTCTKYLVEMGGATMATVWKKGDEAWVWHGPPARRRWQPHTEVGGTWERVILSHDPLRDGNRWVVVTETPDGRYAGFRVVPELHTHQCDDPLHPIDDNDTGCSPPATPLPETDRSNEK